MDNISKHISYLEAIRSNKASQLGIDNTPNEAQLNRMKLVANNIFEPLREHFNVPINVSSMFRSLELNKALGGATTSQHMANNGAAMDLDADTYGGVTNLEIFNYIKNNLDFDQLIIEGIEDGHPSWIHVSYKEVGNRNQVLIMVRINGKSTYLDYTEDNLNKYLK